jgi:HKD family nuclease
MKALLYKNEIRESFAKEIRLADTVSLIMPLVSVGGIRFLEESLEEHLQGGGKLQILLGLDMFTDPEAIQLLMTTARQYPQFLLKRFVSPEGCILHAKVAIFESSARQTAILGSSNFTIGGLEKNFEASLVTTESPVVRSIADYFDQLFSGGRVRDVNLQWLKTYREWWKAAKKVVAQQRRLRRKLQDQRRNTMRVNAPGGIAGKRVAFTGKIQDWPRKQRLYPEVQRLGAEIAERANSMASVSMLFQGDILDRDSTRKIETAKARGIPIYSQDEFFQLRDKARKKRRR